MKKSKKRLKAKQGLTRRLFQDEIDEEEARRQYEESLEKLKQADERMKRFKAENDARRKEQFEARGREEMEKKKIEENQRLKDSKRDYGWKNIKES